MARWWVLGRLLPTTTARAQSIAKATCMKFPTTRYERYKLRQRRYARRRRRFRQHGQYDPATVHRHHHTGPPWEFESGDLQRPPAVSAECKYFTPLPWAVARPGSWAVSPAGHQQPPVVSITDAGYVWRRDGGHHAPFALVGYHVRRALWTGRKIGRMRGRQRAIWFASVHALQQGWFPSWDPLQRHPNSEEEAYQLGWVEGDQWKPPFPIPV